MTIYEEEFIPSGSVLSLEILERQRAEEIRQMVKSAMELLCPAPMGEADREAYKAFVRSQGGPLVFARAILGKKMTDKLRRHLKMLNTPSHPTLSAGWVPQRGPGSLRKRAEAPFLSFVDMVYGNVRTAGASNGPSDAFLYVFETEVARKPYTQVVSQPDRQVTENVNGVLKTTILQGEAERDVPAFELDTSDQLSNKIVIPYVRDTKGNVLTVAHYKKAMGIPMDRKNEEYDRKPVLQIYITRQGGETKLATPVLLKLRHEYDVALKQAVDAMNMAKQKGVFNPEVGAMFAAAKTKKIPWLLLRDAMRSFFQRVANDGQPMTLDTGFGPWPCQGMSFTKGNFSLAVRVLKDDMTDEAKKARAAHILAWRKEQEIKRLQQELDGYGDIPLI